MYDIETLAALIREHDCALFKVSKTTKPKYNEIRNN
jgi:hypothetical protein